MVKLFFLSISVLASFYGPVSTSWAAEPAIGPARSVELSETIPFMVTAIAAQSSTRLADVPIWAIDPRTGNKHILSLDGTVSTVESVAAKSERAFAVARSGADILRLTGSPIGGQFRAEILNSKFERALGIDVEEANRLSDENDLVLLSIYDFALAGDEIFAFGAFQEQPGSDMEFGYFTYPLSGRSEDGVGHLIRTVPKEMDFSLLGLPFIASVGDEVFFLTMADEPQLNKYDITKRLDYEPLAYFPSHGMGGENALLPPIDRGARSLAGALANVDDFDGFPFSVFNFKDDIFVLIRRNAEGGMRTWALDRLRPQGFGLKKVGTSTFRHSADFIRAVPMHDRIVLMPSQDGITVSELLVLAGLPSDMR